MNRCHSIPVPNRVSKADIAAEWQSAHLENGMCPICDADSSQQTTNVLDMITSSPSHNQNGGQRQHSEQDVALPSIPPDKQWPHVLMLFTLNLLRETLSPEVQYLAATSTIRQAMQYGISEDTAMQVINKLIEYRKANPNPLDSLF